MYSRESLQKQIQTKWAGRNVCFFEELDSTNIRAVYEAEKGAVHGTLIVADMQTAGKGRRGRGWSSPPDTNVYFTLLLRPSFAPEKASMLTIVMAYAAARGIEKILRETAPMTMTAGGESEALSGMICGERKTEHIQDRRRTSGIKWPNDLVIHGKKICGILTEMHMQGSAMEYVIIGCGINVGKQEFAPELSDKATSLEQELGRKVPREKLIADIMEAFEEEYEGFERAGNLSGLKEKYHRLLVNLDREVCVLDPSGEYRGIARGISGTGELLVELPDGSIKEVYAGEVSVRGIYGYV